VRGQRLGRFGGAVRVRAVDLYQLPQQFAGRCRSRPET
jgi:hypothetical protein